MKKIYIVGMGMGNPDTLTIGAQNAIENSQAIIGAKRMVDSFSWFQGLRGYEILPEAIADWICEQEELQTVSVVMSGDVGFFSGATKLKEVLSQRNKQGMRCKERVAERDPDVLFDIELLPGISSLQFFSAKLGKPWGNTRIVSLHGREGNAAGEVQTNASTFFLTGSDHLTHDICRELTAAGLGDVKVYVGENLSYPEERLHQGPARELQEQEFSPLSVMLVENTRALKPNCVSYGWEDDCFIRGKVPMTKSEVRSVTLSKLQIAEDDCIYDIGAGTGSVSVELARMARKGRTFAVETNPEAIALIYQNREKFKAWNLQVVQGMAPEAMEELPKPDKAFIGGTKGNMEAVIAALVQKNPAIRVVINAIALESMAEAIHILKDYEFKDIDIVQLSMAKGRPVGNYHLMMGQNPVFIISGQHSV